MVTYEIVIPPQHGSVVITDNIAEYNADPGYEGYDSFTYVKKEDGVEVTTRKVCIEVEVPVYPKIWKAAGGSCEVVNGVITGKLTYTILEEIDTFTGNATGLTKPNVPSDPDYVAPVFDPVACPALKGWRPYLPSAYCVTNPDTSNTGYKGYSEIEEYYLGEGEVATGVRKPNDVGDPDYIAPVEDTDTCPVGITYTAVRTRVFFKNNCSPSTPITNPVQFTKSYQSTISQADADSIAASDPNFNSEGQAFANSVGTCSIDTGALQAFVAFYRPMSACDTRGQYSTMICGTQQDYDYLTTIVSEVDQETGIYFYRDTTGLVPIDEGWYMGLDNTKSFYADSNGQIRLYQNCAAQLPSAHLSVSTDGSGVMTVTCTLGEAYPADLTIQGRVDTNPINVSSEGMDFEVIVPMGSQSASAANFNLVRNPSRTYYWHIWVVLPNNFIITKQQPI